MALSAYLGSGSAWAQSVPGTAVDPVQFECTQIGPQNGYAAHIRVYSQTVSVLQSAPNARFAPLDYRISSKSAPGGQIEDLHFHCFSGPTGAAGYQYKVEIYESEMLIFQSSQTGKYSVLAFDLTK